MAIVNIHAYNMHELRDGRYQARSKFRDDARNNPEVIEDAIKNHGGIYAVITTDPSCKDNFILDPTEIKELQSKVTRAGPRYRLLGFYSYYEYNGVMVRCYKFIVTSIIEEVNRMIDDGKANYIAMHISSIAPNANEIAVKLVKEKAAGIYDVLPMVQRQIEELSGYDEDTLTKFIEYVKNFKTGKIGLIAYLGHVRMEHEKAFRRIFLEIFKSLEVI